MSVKQVAFSRVASAALAAGLWCAGAANAAIIGTDTFNYADGSLNGAAGGSGWTYGGGSTPAAWQNQDGSGATVTAGQAFSSNNNGSRRDYGAAIQAQGVVYFGVDMTFDNVGTEGYAGASSYDFGEERIKFGKRWGQTNFGLEGGTDNGYQGADTSIPIVAGQTYRVVGSIQWDTVGSGGSGNGRLKLWVNPDAADFDAVLGVGAATSADLVVNYFGTGNWNTGVRLQSGGGPVGTPVRYDNLIVATTFAEAAAAVPEPASVGALAAALGAALVRRRRAAGV
jgi:hypothetical protein